MAAKVIITCALTGSGHTPSMSPYLPYTVSDLVDQGVAASGYEQSMQQVRDLQAPEAILKALARGTRIGNEGQFTVHEAIRKVSRRDVAVAVARACWYSPANCGREPSAAG